MASKRRAPPRDDGEIPRPFVKTAGGKARLLPHLMRRAPARFDRYWEQFVGGGALFWHLKREGLLKKGATLADKNGALVRAYRGIRDDAEAVIHLARAHRALHASQGRAYYEAMRAHYAKLPEASDADIAAWLLYVNRAGYNGLFRVNQKGQFNTPYGDGSPILLDEENLRACSRALSSGDVEVREADFEAYDVSVSGPARLDLVPQPGDFVYLDSPYVPVSKTAVFTSYTKDGFGSKDQARLAAYARRLKESRVHVLLTNSDAPLVRELYPEPFWKVERVEVRGDALNSDPAKRGRVGELIIS